MHFRPIPRAGRLKTTPMVSLYGERPLPRRDGAPPAAPAADRTVVAHRIVETNERFRVWPAR